jgi:hypothetical protein
MVKWPKGATMLEKKEMIMLWVWISLWKRETLPRRDMFSITMVCYLTSGVSSQVKPSNMDQESWF